VQGFENPSLGFIQKAVWVLRSCHKVCGEAVTGFDEPVLVFNPHFSFWNPETASQIHPTGFQTPQQRSPASQAKQTGGGR
jgi:hypothetical protein